MKYIDLNKTKLNRIVLKKAGDYVIYFKNYSGKLELIIDNKNISVNIYGLYIGKNNSDYHIETLQHHLVGGSESNLLIKGVFYDESSLNYSGLIKIEKNAQKTSAYLRNDNLLMSEKSHVLTKPYLEIEADDVSCSHAVTIGKLNKDSLYFLNTRGIENSESEKLLVKGFIKEVSIDKLKDSS